MRKVAREDLAKENAMPDVIAKISQRLNDKLLEGLKRGQVIEHSLEYGLGTEAVFRDLLRLVLPLRFGIAKGKLVNSRGMTSRHLDTIVYDNLNCPNLYSDENDNLILPIEGVYAVIEIKSRTTSSVLREAFESLSSVSRIVEKPRNCSTNELVVYNPPALIIFSFADDRKLETIRDNYIKLSEEFPRSYSYYQYSKASPGFKHFTGDTYLVSEISIVGKGSIYPMLDGSIAIGRWSHNTVGLSVMSMISEFNEVQLPRVEPHSYISWIESGVREIYLKAPKAEGNTKKRSSKNV